jgi:hypothetical protein
MIVGGFLGSSYYAKGVTPRFIEKAIDGRWPAFGWRSSDPRNRALTTEEFEGITVSHSVLVIGSSLTHVYFIDPNDPSLPSESRRIYIISYKSFCERIANIYNEWQPDKSHFLLEPHCGWQRKIWPPILKEEEPVAAASSISCFK